MVSPLASTGRPPSQRPSASIRSTACCRLGPRRSPPAAAGPARPAAPRCGHRPAGRSGAGSAAAARTWSPARSALAAASSAAPRARAAPPRRRRARRAAPAAPAAGRAERPRGSARSAGRGGIAAVTIFELRRRLRRLGRPAGQAARPVGEGRRHGLDRRPRTPSALPGASAAIGIAGGACFISAFISAQPAASSGEAGRRTASEATAVWSRCVAASATPSPPLRWSTASSATRPGEQRAWPPCGKTPPAARPPRPPSALSAERAGGGVEQFDHRLGRLLRRDAEAATPFAPCRGNLAAGSGRDAGEARIVRDLHSEVFHLRHRACRLGRAAGELLGRTEDDRGIRRGAAQRVTGADDRIGWQAGIDLRRLGPAGGESEKGGQRQVALLIADLSWFEAARNAWPGCRNREPRRDLHPAAPCDLRPHGTIAGASTASPIEMIHFSSNRRASPGSAARPARCGRPAPGPRRSPPARPRCRAARRLPSAGRAPGPAASRSCARRPPPRRRCACRRRWRSGRRASRATACASSIIAAHDRAQLGIAGDDVERRAGQRARSG